MALQNTKSLNACLLVAAVPFLSFTAYCDRFDYHMFGSATKTCVGTMHTISVIVENAHVEDGGGRNRAILRILANVLTQEIFLCCSVFFCEYLVR